MSITALKALNRSDVLACKVEEMMPSGNKGALEFPERSTVAFNDILICGHYDYKRIGSTNFNCETLPTFLRCSLIRLL
jgi:hypothetical protein